MDPDTERNIIELCGHAGKILLESGAETARVESTVEYIGRAAGIDISCHAEMTAIFVDSNHNPTTHLVKVRTGDFNLQKVDEINTLSRQFTANQITFEQLKSGIERIDHAVIDFNWPEKILGAGLVSVAPMLLFQATWQDLTLAFFVGIIGYLTAQWAGRVIVTPYFSMGIGGLIIGLLAAGLQGLGIATSAQNIIVSALMPLVPGVAITNSLREIIGRHTISGMVRAVDATMTACAIGAGVIIGSLLGHFLTGGL